MSESSFKIEPIVEKDVENVIAFLRRTFYVDEPMNQAVGLCNDTTECLEMDENSRELVLEGLSFKTVDTGGNIIAVVLNGINPLNADNGKDALSEAQNCPNVQFQKMLHILAKKEESVRLWEKFPNDKCLLEIKIAATDPGWRKRGIMNLLVAETEKLAKQRGISLIRMDTSNIYSAKSAERLGFTCLYKALFTDIKLNGEPLIVPEPPHVDDRLYIKRLSD